MNCRRQVQDRHNVCVPKNNRMPLASTINLTVAITRQFGKLILTISTVVNIYTTTFDNLRKRMSPTSLIYPPPPAPQANMSFLKPFYFDNNERTHAFFCCCCFTLKEGRCPDCHRRNNAYLFSKLSIKKNQMGSVSETPTG